MADRSERHQDLTTANRHIAEAEARIVHQAKLVSELGAHGCDTTGAQHLLRLLQRNLDIMNVHRQRIMGELARGP
jgi:hypothetical protein